MRICVVGKYPPIEGGVSRETYWTARRLAERGHQVWVVTNSGEVEPEYRMHLLPEDAEWLEPRFPESGGFVELRQPEPFNVPRMAHIPRTSATVSRLAGLASAVIRAHACDVCFAYYMEPYGMAAYLAHQRSGVPYAIKHAGSDIDRLMLVPELAEMYRDVYRHAAAVVTRRELAGRFLQMGVEESRLALGIGFDMPPTFRPGGPPLDIARVLTTPDSGAFAHIPHALRRTDAPDLRVPTIGIYGKIGVSKGSFDLLEALRAIKGAGLRFNLLAMVNGRQFPQFAQAIQEMDLAGETWLLPFIPHWRVPSFIHACTAVCFLERAFSIKIHGPTVPREVLSCGTCLVVSGEIVEKQHRFLGLRADDTAVVVPDPREHDALARALTRVITDPAWAGRIGQAGRLALEQHTFPDSGGRLYEELFEALAARRPPASGRPFIVHRGEVARGREGEWPVALGALLPRTTRLLDASVLRLWHEHDGGSPRATNGTATAQAREFAAFVAAMCRNGGSRRIGGPSYLADVLAFEQDILRAAAGSDDPGIPRATGGGAPRARGNGDWSRARPKGRAGCIVHRACVDLPALDRALRQGDPAPPELPRADVRMLIVPRSNGSVGLFEVNGTTDALLGLCDGQRTVEDIITAVQARAGAAEPAGVSASVRAAISRLDEQGVLSFC